MTIEKSISLNIRTLDELTWLERLSLVDMSYSRLSTYLSCKAKYFFSYILREPRTFSAVATLGNIVHAALENTLEHEALPTHDEIIAEYEKQVSEYDPEGQIEEHLIEAGHVMLLEFLDRHDPKEIQVVEKEFPFAVVIGRGLFVGYIDRIDVVGDRVEIIDYKSGNYMVPKKDIPTDIQLQIYALIAHKFWPDKQVYASLYYLRKGKQRGHLFTQDDLAAAYERLLDLTDEVIESPQFNYTSNTRTCQYMCDHGKSGACAVGAMRLDRY